MAVGKRLVVHLNGGYNHDFSCLQDAKEEEDVMQLWSSKQFAQLEEASSSIPPRRVRHYEPVSSWDSLETIVCNKL